MHILYDMINIYTLIYIDIREKKNNHQTLAFLASQMPPAAVAALLAAKGSPKLA